MVKLSSYKLCIGRFFLKSVVLILRFVLQPHDSFSLPFIFTIIIPLNICAF